MPPILDLLILDINHCLSVFVREQVALTLLNQGHTRPFPPSSTRSAPQFVVKAVSSVTVAHCEAKQSDISTNSTKYIS